jgi:predicted HTH domain antitoxin
MNVELPDSPVAAANLTAAEARLELAVELFRQERLTLGLASEMAGLNTADLMAELGRRKLPLHYGIAELDADMKTLSRLRTP